MRHAFLLHPGFKEKQGVHALKSQEEKANKVLFNKFRGEIIARYKSRVRPK